MVVLPQEVSLVGQFATVSCRALVYGACGRCYDRLLAAGPFARPEKPVVHRRVLQSSSLFLWGADSPDCLDGTASLRVTFVILACSLRLDALGILVVGGHRVSSFGGLLKVVASSAMGTASPCPFVFVPVASSPFCFKGANKSKWRYYLR
ncbi:hypothetical protein AT3G44755 [Arabidopsis thaliana]|uniref:Uncharacterized protein n=1 Tax=Arabidopsis thaliana TaxID=3702 RepID=F4J379_ARATH|nr:uncharacterized protein AT3G44755 [Arabidopsis thaliana]AEE77946.1 hypothetical protein AT3G44755 [Arabidopsis thaliana]|eukprot:NP_680094.1 hypothetical protein AT3G44755 [Arabidopsis thaliana]